MIYIVCLIVVFGVLAVDLVSKYLVAQAHINAVIIPELVKFVYTTNTGSAFSFLGDRRWAMPMFIILTFIVLFIIVGFVIYSIIKKKKLSKWLLIALSLMVGGAVGNLVDRIAFSYVRDFIFVLYNTKIFTAIFNVADIALVVGVIMLVIYLLFLDDEAIFKKSKK
jgi:signal peptidase II